MQLGPCRLHNAIGAVSPTKCNRGRVAHIMQLACACQRVRKCEHTSVRVQVGASARDKSRAMTSKLSQRTNQELPLHIMPQAKLFKNP